MEDERLVVMLEARISEFEKRMKKAERTGSTSFRKLRGDSRTATRQMEQDMGQASSRINQALASTSSQIGAFGKAFAGGLVGGVVAGAFASFTSNVTDTVKRIAELGDEAKRSGLSAQAFQEWKYVAEQNRIGVDALTDGFKELSLRADEFITTGSGSGAEAFQRLGFSAEDLRKKLEDPSALMLEIIGRLGDMDKAAQIRIADEVFGGSGGERFVELLSQGEEGLRATINRAHEVGAVMDDQMIAKAADLDRRFQELTTRVSTFGKTLAVAIADVPFDVFETRLSELFDNEGLARAMLGDDLFEDLSEARALTDEQTLAVENLRNQYLGLEEDARAAATQLASAAGMADSRGFDDLWQALVDTRTEMMALADEFAEGKISGEDFAAKMAELQENAAAAFAELDAADQVDFAIAIGQVNSLGTAIGAVIGLTRQMAAGLAEAASAAPVGYAPDLGRFGNPYAAPTPNAPTSSPRPREAPTNIDFGVPDVSTGGGGGGGADKDEFGSAVQSIMQETQALQAEATALLSAATAKGAFGTATEFAEAKAKLLTAAMQEGQAITPELEAQIDSLATAYANAGQAAADASDQLASVQERAQQGATAIGGIFMSVLNGSKTATQALAELLAMIAEKQFMKLLTSLAMGGGPMGGVFGMVGAALGFADGGYTGAGGRLEPAGVVHKGEYVFDQQAVRRAGGPAALDAMRRGLKGYSAGGYVGNAPAAAGGGIGTVTVLNYGPAEDVKTTRQRGPDGREMLRVMIKEEFGRGSFDQENRSRYGTSPTKVKR